MVCLSLNPEKSEAIVIGTSARQRTQGSLSNIAVGNITLQPAKCVKSLGVIIDDTLSFNAHVDSVCKAAYFHIRALRHIRKCVPQSVALSIASTMVSARIDYCNAVLHETSKSNINKLQRVQNSLARIVTGARKSDHITPVLASLHWLPVSSRIEYKVALLTFKILTLRQPDYLSELLHLHIPARQLRSGDKVNQLHVCSVKTAFAGRAFSNAAPTVWNSLPCDATEDLSSLTRFKRKLKTHLFQRTYHL